MPKENKSAKRIRRLSLDANDNNPASSIRESTRLAMGTNRFSPFQREIPRRESRSNEKAVTLSHAQVFHPKSGGLIENGIKYIMFPLHLLHLCIFGTGSEPDKEDTEEKVNKEKEKGDKKKKEREQEVSEEVKEVSSFRSLRYSRDSPLKSSQKQSPKTTPKEVEISDDDSDEMVTAAEDSDSSNDNWASAESSMNMSIDYENEKSTLFSTIEEPMDISMEDHHIEKSNSIVKSSRDVRQSKILTYSSGSCASEQEENKVVDQEIVKIFEKQYTSSEDESPVSSGRIGRRQNSSRHYEESRNVQAGPGKAVDIDHRRKRTPVNVTPKRDRVRDEEEKKGNRVRDEDEKKRNGCKTDKSQEEQRDIRQNTPSKYRQRSSKTPVKGKEGKRKVKYKETSTQTDSAFSDDDVEMIPVDVRSPEKRSCHRFSARKTLCYNQVEEMDQDLDYVADNEDSNDGTVKYTRNRISSSTSSSSTDLGFDERRCTTPEISFRLEQCWTNSADPTPQQIPVTRAPPGFPEIPQNPPLISRNCFNTFLSVPERERHNQYKNVIPTTMVSPAPLPMRHLYYNYPEFMVLPEDINSSKVLRNIFKKNYGC